MNQHTTYLTKTILVATCLAFGCGDSEGGPTVDSQLVGVYQISRYEGSLTDCDQPTDLGPADRLVLYSFRPNDNPDEPLLGGAFCTDLADCRGIASAAPEPTIGYSFRQGSDEGGWFGWAITSAGAAADQCRADVQAHVLTSTSADAIDIESKTFETVFPPMVEGSTATCRNADALASLDPDNQPCEAIIILEATREADL